MGRSPHAHSLLRKLTTSLRSGLLQISFTANKARLAKPTDAIATAPRHHRPIQPSPGGTLTIPASGDPRRKKRGRQTSSQGEMAALRGGSALIGSDTLEARGHPAVWTRSCRCFFCHFSRCHLEPSTQGELSSRQLLAGFISFKRARSFTGG